MNGAVELHKECSKQGIKPIFGCEIYLVDDHRSTRATDQRSAGAGARGGGVKVQRNHLTLLAADDSGYRNLVKLSSAGFLEGLQRGKPTVDLEQIAKHSEGVIALTGCLASRFCQLLGEDRAGDARAPRRRAAGGLRRRQRLLRAPAQRDRPPGQVQRGHRADRRRSRRKPGGDRRRALPASRGLRPPHGAAVRADQEHAGRPQDDVRHQRVLPARQRRDGRVLRAVAAGSGQHARDRRALLGAARARQAADPQLPDPRRGIRAGVPARASAGGTAPALRRPAAGAGDRAHGDGARRDRRDGLQRLLPDRLGLRQVRQGERHRGRTRARLGGRLDRGVLPADHRRRPAALRAAVRALPEPRAGVDAGHRHRLLGARSRAGDALRHRQVRAGVGRADRDLRQDVPARRHPRRRPGAGLRLRRRGPARQADPRPDHGPRAVVRRLPEDRRAAAQGLRRGARGAPDHRRRPGPRGDRAQLLDPRRRRRDRRPPADRHRAAAARRRWPR